MDVNSKTVSQSSAAFCRFYLLISFKALATTREQFTTAKGIIHYFI